jgi:hypothetical protein
MPVEEGALLDDEDLQKMAVPTTTNLSAFHLLSTRSHPSFLCVSVRVVTIHALIFDCAQRALFHSNLLLTKPARSIHILTLTVMTLSEVEAEDTCPDIHIPEILANIVSHLDDHVDDDQCGLPTLEGASALLACSKASHALFEAVRRACFRSVSLLLPGDNLHPHQFRCNTFLDRANRVALMTPYVRGLTLLFPPPNERDWSAMSALNDIFPFLINLEEITLINVPLNRRHGDREHWKLLDPIKELMAEKGINITFKNLIDQTERHELEWLSFYHYFFAGAKTVNRLHIAHPQLYCPDDWSLQLQLENVSVIPQESRTVVRRLTFTIHHEDPLEWQIVFFVRSSYSPFNLSQLESLRYCAPIYEGWTGLDMILSATTRSLKELEIEWPSPFREFVFILHNTDMELI